MMHRALWAGGFAAALFLFNTATASDERASHLSTNTDTPQTWLQSQKADAGLARAMPESALTLAQVAQTGLREAEVPAHLLERTRILIQDLQATATPEQAISINLPADVLFDFDKAQLRTDALPQVLKAAELVQSYPEAPLTVRGHTDGKGSDAYNDDLSLRRARAVAALLLQHSGREAKIEGLGKREPIAPNTRPDGRDNPEGRQRNRRVQILIAPPSA